MEPYVVKVPFRTKVGDDVLELPVAVNLPHEVFSHLYRCDPDVWEATFGTDTQRVQYWNDLREEWWNSNHPAYATVMSDPVAAAHAVPVRLHGDDGAFKKGLVRLSMLVMSLTGAVTFSESAATIMLLFGLLLQNLLDHTVDELLKVITHSPL